MNNIYRKSIGHLAKGILDAFITHNSQLVTRNLFFLLLLLFASCCCKEPSSQVEDVPIENGSVMVLNEGNYTYGNGSVTYYVPSNNHVYEDIYQLHNKRPLGDVAFSMIGVEDEGYIVVNNSNKIEVVDLYDFTERGAIVGLTSPRYILPIGDGTAYVSDLYAEKLTIIDLSTKGIVGEIALPGWTEQMVLAEGKVFVANYDSMRVEVIAQGSKIDDIDVGGHPMEMVVDAQGQVWVLGQREGSDGAVLTRINPVTMVAELALPFAANEAPTDLITDANGNNLYFIKNDGIHRMASTATVLPTQPIIPKGNRNYYAIGISPDNAELFASDALDFNQRSDIYIFSLATVQQVDSFKAGIISGGFYFYPR